MDIFSYHLIDAPVHEVLARLLFSGRLAQVDGLQHSECLLTMKMGASVMSPGRYNFGSLAFFGWWRDTAALDAFLERPPYRVFERPGWHVRLKFYRKWGDYAGLGEAPLHSVEDPGGEVVAVTLARLKLQNTLRFARWGRPVEQQIRDHPGQTCARVAFRPVNTFSTFSIWESEEAMRGMVRGMSEARDGVEHRNAMVERARNPFHHEFMTLRFVPLAEHGDRPPH